MIDDLYAANEKFQSNFIRSLPHTNMLDDVDKAVLNSFFFHCIQIDREQIFFCYNFNNVIKSNNKIQENVIEIIK